MILLAILTPYMGVIPNQKMAFIFPISCILVYMIYFPKCEGKGSFPKSQNKITGVILKALLAEKFLLFFARVFLQSVSVAFPGHTHLLFKPMYCLRHLVRICNLLS